MKYKEAYEKIIQAYFKDEMLPMEAKFCFCGTLCNNDSKWFYKRDYANNRYGDSHGYSGIEFYEMEQALFRGMSNNNKFTVSEVMTFGDYEDRLFAGMCAALDVLKEIHRSRGENVDEIPVFEKRKLELTELIKP